MINLSLHVKGVLLGAPCHAKVISTNGVIKLCGEVSSDDETFSNLLKTFSISPELSKALCSLLQLPANTRLLFSYSDKQSAFAVKTEGLCLAAAKTSSAPVFLLSLNTTQLANSENILLKITYEAARLLCLDSLYLQVGKGRLPVACTQATEINLPAITSAKIQNNNLVVIGQMKLTDNNNILAQGLQALLGIHEITFAVMQDKSDITAGLYLEQMTTGDISVKNLCIMVSNRQLYTSGELKIGDFHVILNGSMGIGEFSLQGALPYGKSISLGHGWYLDELALSIGFNDGLTISMLGRIRANKLMMFTALRVAILPPCIVELQLISAAASPLSLRILVESLTNKVVVGIENFDFIQIDGFSLPNAPCLTHDELAGGVQTIPAGVVRALTSAKLAPEGEVRISPFGEDWIVTDAKRMRHYIVKKDGHILLNPQFYYATCDQSELGGYSIQRGTFFCGVLRLFGYYVKVFFQSDDNGVMAYLNIQPIQTKVLTLNQSSYKQQSRNIQMPSPGALINQYLDPNTNGPELFLCMSASEQCFYLDARMQIWSVLNFDAHILFADKKVSIDAHFPFLKLFEVDLHVNADYSSFQALSFEFLLTANTNGLKKLVEKAVNKLEQASKKFNDSMQNAVNKVNESRNSLDGLWNQIHVLDGKIQACKNRLNRTSRWKRWIVAIGVGLEIGGYEIAKAGLYVAIGVAQAALSLAEGILRAAQAVGNVTLNSIQNFLKGITALFYIQRLTLAGIVNASQMNAALAIQMDFVALGKTHSVKGTLSLGSGAGERCGQLLNGMVEDNTKKDIQELEQGTRISKQRYRFAALEGNLELFCQGNKYCKSVNKYLEKFGEACVEQYGGIPSEADEVLAGIDSAMFAVQQNSELVCEIIDKIKFSPALKSLEKNLNDQPESRVRAARKKNLEQLNEKWNELCKIKKIVRNHSNNIRKSTKQRSSQFMHDSEKNAAINQPTMTMSELNPLDPDGILDKAENLMYHSFTPQKDDILFCPYCEPVILKSLDDRRINPQKGLSKRQKQRTYRKINGYTPRL